jgi:adenosylcobinamide-GDP ribazoletransferase
MKAFFAALQFLTILPLPASWTGNGQALQRSVPCFPLVGFFLGVLAAASHLLLDVLFPPAAAVCLTVLILTAVTGGLHLDGLADTADGLFSARSRERMLEIMRDSRIGTMGVLALVFAIGLKVAALLPLGLNQRLAALVLMPLAGRTAMVCMLTLLTYARPDGGLASIFLKRRPWPAPVIALCLLLAAGWGLASQAGLTAALFSLASAGYVIRYTSRKIGGFTGDTLGAGSEVAEVALALAFAAWAHTG